jgi:hypothetical protein
MKPLSKRFKREVVSVATVFGTLILYIPFMDSRWAIFVSLCAGYSIVLFGLAWSDGKWQRYFGGNGRSTGQILQAHFVFLLLIVGWIWFAQLIKPRLPSWVVIEGDMHESWFLAFAALAMIGILIAEMQWLSSKPKP